jgi:tripartite-type tricarboxylate transporter receptor subunit TctC
MAGTSPAMTSKKVCALMIAGISVAALATPASAADFYAGKTMEFVVGGYPGGGFDIYMRTLARHMASHIPGNPTIVVKNMPGAGSVKAGHYISTLAAKDGTSIGGVTPGSIINPLLSGKKSLFDPTAVTWLGTANSGTRICATYGDSKIKTFDDALKQTTRLGGVSPGDAVHDYAFMVKRTTRAKIQVVPGYKGTLDLTLAMQRGEIDGMCGWDWSSAKAQKSDWIRDGKLHVLAQIGLEANPGLTQRKVPELLGYAKDDSARKTMELIVSQQAFSRPYFTAKEVPQERVQLLRAAFDATMKDPQYLADANKMHIDISPLSGAKVQDLVAKLYATPKDIVEHARAAIKP